MHVLQKLRFSGRRITTEKNVNLASEAATTRLGELLGHSTEELAQYALLHIVALPDRGSQRVDKDVLDIGTLRKLLELFNLLLGKTDFIKASITSHISMTLLILIRLSSCILLFLHLDIFSSTLVVLELLFTKFESLLVTLDISDNIDVSSVDILESPLLSVDSDSHGFVNTGDFNSVARAHVINEVLIRTQVNRLRGFALWH